MHLYYVSYYHSISTIYVIYYYFVADLPRCRRYSLGRTTGFAVSLVFRNQWKNSFYPRRCFFLTLNEVQMKLAEDTKNRNKQHLNHRMAITVRFVCKSKDARRIKVSMCMLYIYIYICVCVCTLSFTILNMQLCLFFYTYAYMRCICRAQVYTSMHIFIHIIILAPLHIRLCLDY